MLLVKEIGMEDFWLGGELDSDIIEIYRERIRGREEDVSLVFDTGVKFFVMVEYIVEYNKILFFINIILI